MRSLMRPIVIFILNILWIKRPKNAKLNRYIRLSIRQ